MPTYQTEPNHSHAEAPEVLALLQKQVADAGGLGFGDDPDAIVEQMRKTRQEIFEADYAHLYR